MTDSNSEQPQTDLQLAGDFTELLLAVQKDALIRVEATAQNVGSIATDKSFSGNEEGSNSTDNNGSQGSDDAPRETSGYEETDDYGDESFPPPLVEKKVSKTPEAKIKESVVELYEIPKDIEGFYPPRSRTYQRDKRQFVLRKETIETARAEKAAYESALVEQEAEFDKIEAEIAEHLHDESFEKAMVLLQHERLQKLLEDPSKDYMLAKFLYGSYVTRVVQGLEKKLGITHADATVLLDEHEFQDVVTKARNQYATIMESTGQSADAFGERSSFDLRTNPVVAQKYVPRMLKELLVRAYNGELFQKPVQFDEQPRKLQRMSLRMQAGVLALKTDPLNTLAGMFRTESDESVYRPLSTRLSQLANETKLAIEEKFLRVEIAKEICDEEIARLKNEINTAAQGDKLDSGRLYVFEGEYGQLESTLDTLERFGGILNESIEPRGLDKNRRPLRLVIAGYPGGVNEHGVRDLKSILLERAGRYKSYVPQKPGSITNQVSIVALIQTAPDGTEIEPIIVELIDEGNNGDLGATRKQYYTVIAERVARGVADAIKDQWTVLELLHKLTPVGKEVNQKELSIVEKEGELMSSWWADQLAENRAWAISSRVAPSQLMTPPVVGRNSNETE